MRLLSSSLLALLLSCGIFLVAASSFADEPAKPPTVEDLKKELEATSSAIAAAQQSSKVMADTIWVMATAMLVFFMNLGFACVESGFCRAKNCVNILSKNFIVFAATSIGFWLVGWGIMFGNGTPFFGNQGVVAVSGPDSSPATAPLTAKIKSDIKEKFGLDLDDAAAAEKESKLVDAITALGEDPRGSFKKIKETGADGKEAEKEVIAVKLDVPGKGTFESQYDPKEYYWGAYAGISWPSVPLWAKFFFQLVFAGTAATIVSGAVAERIKYHSFIIFSFVMAVAIYPVVGHWIWGGGWLAARWNFFDFAGSTQVHSIGGWAALAGVLILGPRIGKYGPDGKINAIPGHNLTAATIGCFVLWFGWFGFNPGSTMAADVNALSEIAITTNTAAAMATLTATVTAWLLLGKPDLGMTLNGCLAGLVAITAPCAFVTVPAAALIGGIAGILVVLAVLMFDRLRIDDPVGATSVHLVNGVFGTLCVGLFAEPTRVAARCLAPANTWSGLFYGGGVDQLLGQAVGVGATALYVLVVASIAWLVLKYTVGIRVSPEEELEGLDIGEHGNEAYHGFVMALETVTAPGEPRAATVPPNSQRFTVVVDGVNNGDLMHTWSGLCQPKGTAPAEFKAVYPYVTTVQGNRFRCRGGDPETVRGSLENLLRTQMKASGVKVRVEK